MYHVWYLTSSTAILTGMIHIGIDSRLTYYRTGGTATYIRELVRALHALDDQNRYTIFRSRKDKSPDTVGFHQAHLWTPSHHKWERLSLSVELLPHRLDVFHSPDFIPPQYGAHRHVITVHDLTFLHYPEYLTADSRRYYNDQIQWAAEHADHILTVSESAKNDLIRMLNVSPEKITIQPHGVDHQHYRPMDQSRLTEILTRFGVTPGYFLFVGTIEPRKNLDHLLTAYAALRTQSSTVPDLILIGKRGWLADALIERIGHSVNVRWLDTVTDADLPAFYNGARALVLPSFYEGFGLPILEAMACGTLPVVSDRSSLPEVAGDVGLRLQPEEPASITQALHAVLDADPDWLQAQREAALARAATFTWEHSARIARDVYQKTVSNP